MSDVTHCRQETISAADTAARPVELAVVIPALNEQENVTALVDQLATVLTGIPWEAVFADDDSPHGTASSGTSRAVSAAFIGSGAEAFPPPASSGFLPARPRSLR